MRLGSWDAAHRIGQLKEEGSLKGLYRADMYMIQCYRLLR